MYSLRRRLLIFAALLLILFLGVTAIGLNNAFKKSVLSNAQDALQNQVLLLISNVDVIDGKVFVPEVLSEARLSQTDSTLFAQIYNDKNEILWRSQSLLDQELPIQSYRLGAFLFDENLQWQFPIYSVTFELEWETDEGDVPFVIQVAENSKIYTGRLARYQQTFGIWPVSYTHLTLPTIYSV